MLNEFELPNVLDRRRARYTRGATRGQHANQWLRESHLQIL